jgi:hypothetical protein
MPFRRLDPQETVATVAQLVRRVAERFPGAGLVQVCEELLQLAQQATATAERIARPLYALRAGIGALVAAIVVTLAYSVSLVDMDRAEFSASDVVQAAEASLNGLALVGAAIFFLVTIETRVKRARALAALHELRSMAHVVDMHQLTKDPVIPGVEGAPTPSSPLRNLSDFELARYLDYCSEMLALLGKIAALYAQAWPDREVTSAVNEIEVLTSGLSGKIWDKIQAIHSSHRPD